MAHALRLARRGLYTTDPNPRVGCVIVRDGDVVGEGWHVKAGDIHAEIMALGNAGAAAAGATAYVTLEPCCHHGRTPPCTDSLVAAGIERVVLASRDPNPDVSGSGEAQLTAAGVTVDSGVLEAETKALNIGFFQRMQSGRPYVRSKLAVSLDGRTALANGESKWITGDAARADVQRLRARSSAILTGIGTVLSDNPSLNVRLDELAQNHQPTRVVADSQMRMPADAVMVGLQGQVRIFCAKEDSVRRVPLEKAGVIVEVLPARNDRVRLDALLSRLADLEFNEVLIEAGPTLNGGLLEDGLIDELVVYVASHILGADGRSMFQIPELARMTDRKEFELVELRRVGADSRMTYRIN